MTRAYSEDLRERALARFEAGETIRTIGVALGISPSCVSKWAKRKRETGSLAPGQVGGHKPRTLSGEIAIWLGERLASGPFTTRGLERAAVLRNQDSQIGGALIQNVHRGEAGAHDTSLL